jgi:glycine betaine/proline transport system substrate-binding protein
VAVPDYSDVTSLSDLPAKAGEHDGPVVGIEPGSGLSRVLKAKKPVVVALWRPHWAYSALPIRDLKDPKGLLGPPEQIHAIGRNGFAQDYPDVAKMLSGFRLDDASLGSLEDLVLNKYGDGQGGKAVTEWITTHPDALRRKTGG